MDRQHPRDLFDVMHLFAHVTNKTEWPLLGIEHLDQLPGIRWKLRNISLLQQNHPKKFAEQADTLARLLA